MARKIRYLISAECTTPNANTNRIYNGSKWIDPPAVLRHCAFRVVTTEYPHYAASVAEEFARTFRLTKAKELTREQWDSTAQKWNIVTPELLQVTFKVETEKKRSRKTTMAPLTGDAREEREKRQAINYARWLANRDGIELPRGDWRGNAARVVWSQVYSKYEKRNQHYWGGSREVARTFKRAMAVEWGEEVDVFNTRKDGRQGAFLYKEWRCDARIEIPNWDFEHPPIELCETVSDAA